MATTNIWQQFKALIPEGVRAVATITIPTMVMALARQNSGMVR
ncbi:hypothetical protein [Endozoicomonas sp.]|nr:hypothetical protein [Endozoicomonas sp.]